MMEILLFTLNAIVIYLVADWIIRLIEIKRGQAIKQRQLVFFIVFLSLALTSFQILQSVFQPA